MRPAFYDNPAYKQKQSRITRRYWQGGFFSFKIKPLIDKICKNPNCRMSFQVKPYYPKIYCSRSCSATINNSKRARKIHPKSTIPCIVCGEVIYRNNVKYCSLKCQQMSLYHAYINDWKTGKVDGNKGITTTSISRHIRHYLIEKYQGCCSVCGWNERNPQTGKVPLEVDHINGDANNTSEGNLRLLCPNCHSLTSNFRNLNKGNGRSWRLEKIKQQKAGDNSGVEL